MTMLGAITRAMWFLVNVVLPSPAPPGRTRGFGPRQRDARLPLFNGELQLADRACQDDDRRPLLPEAMSQEDRQAAQRLAKLTRMAKLKVLARDILISVAVVIALASVILPLTIPSGAARTHACAAPAASQNATIAADLPPSPAAPSSLADGPSSPSTSIPLPPQAEEASWAPPPAPGSPGGNTSAGRPPSPAPKSWTNDAAPGACTIDGSLQLEGYILPAVSSGLVGLAPTAQKLLQRIRPGGAPHHTGRPLLWVLGAAIILFGANAAAAGVAALYAPHLGITQAKAAVFSAAMCGPLGTFVDLAVVCKWRRWACLSVPLVTVLLLSFATWGALGRTGDPAAFWAGCNAGIILQATCRVCLCLITWPENTPADLKLQAEKEETDLLRAELRDTKAQLAVARHERDTALAGRRTAQTGRAP